MISFNYAAPEAGGIPSGAIKNFLEVLEKAELSTHSIVIARGNSILFEKYYPPFHKAFLHRLYSDTKSWVSIAVGFAVDEGLVSLDAPIGRYFPTECRDIADKNMGEQTVREMLKMSVPKLQRSWFAARCSDRVADYFENTRVDTSKGESFFYDSTGSFILGAMVERVTGKSLLDYLKIKLFEKIGISDEIKCLKCPGGHSWADSAILARPEDSLRLLRFLLDGGKHGGEQLLSAEYIKQATAKLIDTDYGYGFNSQGYGYQIWRTYKNSFFFNGMGSQYAVACPDKDIMFVINSDNQGIDGAGEKIMSSFFELVYDRAGEPLPPDGAAHAELLEYADSLKLYVQSEAKASPCTENINGKTFALKENTMGFKWVKFSFSDGVGLLEYENAQGEKSLPFGMGRNVFGIFPEEGYSREVGSVYAEGNYYKCAASAAWQNEHELLLNVQIIDEYFGRLWMHFCFDDNKVKIISHKVAEDFLAAYNGEALGELI